MKQSIPASQKRRDTHSKRPRRTSGTPGLQVGRRFQADVKREARSLGLSTQEYLRLLVALSKSLRHGLLRDRKVDAKALLELAESPVFGAMIQYVGQSAGSLVKSAEGQASEQQTTLHDPSAAQNSGTQPPFEQPASQPGLPAQNPQPQPAPPPTTGWVPLRPVQQLPQPGPAQGQARAGRRVIPLPVQFYS